MLRPSITLASCTVGGKAYHRTTAKRQSGFIGPLSKATASAARHAGLRNVFWSPTVKEALQDPAFQARRADVVLFKASRLVGLERLHEAVHTELTGRAARRKKSAPKGAGKSRRSSVRT